MSETQGPPAVKLNAPCPKCGGDGVYLVKLRDVQLIEICGCKGPLEIALEAEDGGRK